MKFLLSITWEVLFSFEGCTFGRGEIKIWFGSDICWKRGMRKCSAGGGGPHLSPITPVGKTVIQVHTFIIVNNVYCVAVESFNTE